MTKQPFLGDLKTEGGGQDGLSGADNLCNQAASTAGLGGTWKAWLSSSEAKGGQWVSQSGFDRIADVGPWSLLDGTRVFDNKTAMKTFPSAAINLTETGDTLAQPESVWTATDNDAKPSVSTCNGWTLSTNTGGGAGQSGAYGQPTVTNWTQFSVTQCDQGAHLYCVEQ